MEPWSPRQSGFSARYDAPRDQWDWLLRGVDPLVFRIQQEMKQPVHQRPVFMSLSVFADKFRRGVYIYLPLFSK